MKQLTEKVCKLETLLVGGQDMICRQRFEVEESDIGVVRPHYGGHNYKALKFTRSDVGKSIEVMTDGRGWTCWGFIL